MSLGGTARYASEDPATLPPRVQAAVAAAQRLDFDLCVHPATGRLLQSLGAGVAPGGTVAEVGTGTGAGLAWLTSFASADVEVVSIEIDADRAAAANKVFADADHVTVLHGDAGDLYRRGPFDLLVFDGGWGTGKAGDTRVTLADVVAPNGTFTIDDFAPMAQWPPMFNGEIDDGRFHWLEHPDVLATEVQVAPDMAVLVARHIPGRSHHTTAA